MAEIEKSTEAQAQITSIQTKTTNIHGDEIQTVTTTNYEQQVFSSKSDWRVRAISATNLPLRVQHIFVSNDDVKDDAGSLTFVIPKNVLKTFIVNADLRTQVAAFLYGKAPADNPQVREVTTVVYVPQRGSHGSVELPTMLPQHEFLLQGLEPLGWIKTQSSEVQHLSPVDVAQQAKIMSANPEWAPTSICLTASFTPGSISLSAWELTPAGFEWGRKQSGDLSNPVGFSPSMAGRVQLLLSDRILGSTLVPTGDVWNYSVGLGQLFTPQMSYSVTLGTPKPFWDECHRCVALASSLKVLAEPDSFSFLVRLPSSASLLSRAMTTPIMKIRSLERCAFSLSVFSVLNFFLSSRPRKRRLAFSLYLVSPHMSSAFCVFSTYRQRQ